MKDRILVLIAVLALVACNNTLPAEEGQKEITNMEQISKEIELVYGKFTDAYATLNAEKLDSLYEDNAYYLSPGSTIRSSKAEFMNGFTEMFESSGESGQKLNISFKIISRKFIDRQTVIDIGYYQLIRILQDGEPGPPSVGKFVTVLRKQKDGNWRFIIDSYSEAPADAFTES